MTTFQFVADMASVSPSVVLDLNVPPLNVKSYDLSPPDFVKSYATGSMLDGQRILSDTAQNRLLLISLQVVSTTAAGFSGAVESLGRQLAKDNILKFQPDNSAGPVFFRTFANPRYAAQVRSVLTCAVDYQIVSLEIEAEFAAYGPRVEVPGSPFTVTNSPAVTGINPCSFDVTGVGGDMPTPLLIHATSTGVTGTPSGLMQKWSHIGMRRRGTPSGYSNVIQAELMTQGTDAVATTDATFSGGSKSRISFATQNVSVLRLSDTFPADGVATVEARGEYIVYARVARTVAGGTIHIQLGYGASSTAPIMNDAVVVPGTANNPVVVNLGKVPVPVGSDPIEHGFSGVQTKVVLPFVGIYADRVSGTSGLDVDYLYFVPADDLTLIAQFPSDNTTYAIDGTTDAGGAVYALTAALDEVVTTATPCQIVGGGGFPEAIPGQTNRVHFIRHVDPTGAAMTGAPFDPVSSTTTLHVYCWPRWRELTRT